MVNQNALELQKKIHLEVNQKQCSWPTTDQSNKQLLSSESDCQSRMATQCLHPADPLDDYKRVKINLLSTTTYHRGHCPFWRYKFLTNSSYGNLIPSNNQQSVSTVQSCPNTTDHHREPFTTYSDAVEPWPIFSAGSYTDLFSQQGYALTYKATRLFAHTKNGRAHSVSFMKTCHLIWRELTTGITFLRKF